MRTSETVAEAAAQGGNRAGEVPRGSTLDPLSATGPPLQEHSGSRFEEARASRSTERRSLAAPASREPAAPAAAPSYKDDISDGACLHIGSTSSR